MATLLAPVFLCEKPNIPLCNLFKWEEGPAWHTHGSHIVLTLITRLAGVNGPLLSSLKNTALIFPEIFFIQYFTILVANIMMSSFS